MKTFVSDRERSSANIIPLLLSKGVPFAGRLMLHPHPAYHHWSVRDAKLMGSWYHWKVITCDGTVS